MSIPGPFSDTANRALDGTLAGFPPGAWDLDTLVRTWIHEEINAQRLGETYWFSVQPTIVNGPGGISMPGFQGMAAGNVVTVYARDPSAIGTPAMLTAGAVQVGWPTREEMRDIVAQLLGDLRGQAVAALRP